MILQSLYELYDRLSRDKDYNIAPPNYSIQKIVFRIVLKPNGDLHAIEDARIKGEKDRLVPRRVLVPGHSKKSGSGFNPCFLWDNSAYMLGYKPEDDNPARTAKCFEEFRDFHLKRASDIDCSSYRTVCHFLEKWEPEQATNWPVLDEIGPGYGVFQIIGETAFVHDDPDVRKFWEKSQSAGDDITLGQCLITGQYGPVARLHDYKIKHVGSQGESLLVSFNDLSFESYGKVQSFNAPVSEDAAFRYATALNALLDGPKSHKHRLKLGDAVVVFWTKEPTNTEDIFAQFITGTFEQPLQEIQDESVRQKIELFLEALRKGREYYTDLDRNPNMTPFYLLALTGQAKGRIGIRFFYRDTLDNLLNNLHRHYCDMKMERQFDDDTKRPDPEFPSLMQVLDETCPRVKGKADREKIPPIIEGPLLRGVIAGTTYPAGLFSSVMRRIHADRKVNYIRACVIAGYLRRNLKQEVSMSLSKERKDPAYRLGRLFAVLEKVQGEALGKLGATIRDRFYSAASATPGMVFPRLLRTYQHHLTKLEGGLKLNRERLVQEILEPLENFPGHLDLAAQGTFALGYYHQSKDLWTSKEKKENEKGE